MAKTVYILRGVSGSGKSTYAAELAKQHRYTVICSADAYFIDEGNNYNWNPKYLRQAHEWCYNNFRTALTKEAEYVILDNTNTRLREFEKYIRLAKVWEYDIKVIRFECSLRECAKANQHKVDLETITKQYQRFEPYPGEEVISR